MACHGQQPVYTDDVEGTAMTARVLIIEDDASSHELVRYLLEAARAPRK